MPAFMPRSLQEGEALDLLRIVLKLDHGAPKAVGIFARRYRKDMRRPICIGADGAAAP